jgi:hypothetical protein
LSLQRVLPEPVLPEEKKPEDGAVAGAAKALVGGVSAALFGK